MCLSPGMEEGPLGGLARAGNEVDPIVLRGAKLVDGTGAQGRAADVVVRGARVAAVQEPGTADGEIVNLDGLVLAPGIVDCHTHYDAQILWDPDLTPSCWHGVTTVVMGNCGFSLAPTRQGDRETIARTLENVEGMALEALAAGIPWDFETFPEYLDAVEALPPRLNVAAMIGHTPLRTWVLGADATEREASDGEIAEMRGIVAEALDAGAVGFATSKQGAHVGAYGKPVPSRFASAEEINSIAEALGDRGRGTVAVTRGEDFDLQELAALSLRIGRPVTWTALPASPTAMATLREGHELGGEVWPQIACRPVVMQLTLADPGPLAKARAFTEVLALPRDRRAELFVDQGWRDRARRDVLSSWGDRYGRMFVSETDAHVALRDGPSIAQIAAERGEDPFDTLCDLALADNLTTRFRVVLANDDEESLTQLLMDDRTLVGLSDAGAHASQLCDAVFSTHLLQHWVRETGVLSLEKAVWRVTGHPAQVYGLPGRGLVAPGAFADLLAFDPDAIAVKPAERVWDFPAGADRLVAGAEGIEAVWVNGVRTRAAGADLDGVRPGRLIRDGGR